MAFEDTLSGKAKEQYLVQKALLEEFKKQHGPIAQQVQSLHPATLHANFSEQAGAQSDQTIFASHKNVWALEALDHANTVVDLDARRAARASVPEGEQRRPAAFGG